MIVRPFTINCAHKLYAHGIELHTHVANANAKRKNFGSSPFQDEDCTDSFCAPVKKSDSTGFTPSLTEKNHAFNFSFHECIHCGQNGKTFDCTDLISIKVLQHFLRLMQLPPWWVTCKKSAENSIHNSLAKLE